MKTLKNIIVIPCFAFLLFSCGAPGSESVFILKGKDLSSGNWMLLNRNSGQNTTSVIADNELLKRNVGEVEIMWNKEDENAKCDGLYQLYKDGALVAEHKYRDFTSIIESQEIRSAYKDSGGRSFKPKSKEEFRQLWDSLGAAPGFYLTHVPDAQGGEDFIVMYKVK